METLSYAQLMERCLAAEAERDAVVAENVALKSCAEFYSSGFSPVKGTFGLEWEPTEKLLDDCGNVASEALDFARQLRESKGANHE